MEWQFKVGIGVAILFGLLPFAVKDMPHWATWPGLSIGGLLILWGLLPRHDEFPLLPTILFIVLGAGAVACAAWGYDLLPTTRNESPGLFVDCSHVVVPVKAPPDGRFFVLDLWKLPEDRLAGGLAIMTMPPGTDYRFSGSWLPIIQRCELTNYDSIAITNVEIRLLVTFQEVVHKPDGTNESRPVNLKRAWPIKIGKIDPGVSNPFVFYAVNLTNEMVRVIFPDTATAQRMGSSVQKPIPITNSDNIWMIFPPAIEEEKKEDNK
jgi:hypothetical protein